jgi:hypothetical protein
MERLKNLGIIPVNKDVLYSLFNDLKQPKDKLSELECKGIVIRVKRNLYVISPKVHHQTISTELVANHLYSPSYVSLESALAYYGLIPERVYAMRSVCLTLYKQYNTPLGYFEYVKVPEKYYPIGVCEEIIDNAYAFLIASPEKALCDKIVTTQNLRLQSVKAIAKETIDFTIKNPNNGEMNRKKRVRDTFLKYKYNRCPCGLRSRIKAGMTKN